MRSLRSACALATLIGCAAAFSVATELERYIPSTDDLRRAERPSRDADARAYKLRIAPHWSSDGDFLWYRNDLRDDRREFILVDVIAGRREPAFDHDRLAAALTAKSIKDVTTERLPIESLWIDAPNQLIEFRADGKYWRCRLDLFELTEIEPTDRTEIDNGVPAWAPADAPRASFRNGEATELTFANRTDGPVEMFWLDSAGKRVSYGIVAAGAELNLSTYAGHVWAAANGAGETLVVFAAEESPGVAEITGAPPRRRGPVQRERRNRDRTSRNRSPDGKWIALIRDHNLLIRNADSDELIQLSTDGRDGFAYDEFEWSPDSKTLVAARTQPGDDHQVHTLESSPESGGRARLRSRSYPLPGDKFPVHELNIFSVADRSQIKPAVDRIDFEASRPHWLRGGEACAYEQVDRGHQRYRLSEINCHTGAARTLIDEQSDTFIWTAHLDGDMPRPITWLDNDDELIYSSERDGWRHLYLFDAKAGVVKNQITHGEWVVRALDRVDEDKRQFWFRASGMNPGQDPYFIHHYRINFDGTGLIALTAGDGTHRVEYSPDGRFLIDSYSRVDLPTVHELRRVEDGSLVCELDRADASELKDAGWRAPEPFVALGRDGKTSIYGIICRPPNFDPKKRYPVIEGIYAGPQGSFVPKSFSAQRQYSALTALSFIVVQIDGMGTANRSKAFHDVCWHNLKDAGFPDRILWHKAVAAKYPQYDLDRLGIYGGSAGGQNAAAAVLFHGDFYKAAVAGCGCHDNRMDKASWNEQWMGYPVGPQYAASSNIEHAAQLTGKLMLIVGELDDNVPPESTYRFADALIKAGKDFDLVVVPSAGHGMGGEYGMRRLRDFFIRHLHGIEPLDRNQP
jgi:dipeptidyl-peptidase 4